MEPRLSLVTLGVADLARAAAFYEALGWPRRVRGAQGAAFFQLGPLALSLYPRADLARDAGVRSIAVPTADGPAQGFTLAHNTRTRAEVDAVMDAAAAAGGTITQAAQEAFWGGYHGHFADPDGFLWEVAWNPAFAIGADGALGLPE